MFYTKSNLSAWVESKFGDCLGKKGLTELVKKYNLDVIHNTIHSMCKDKAKHDRAFEGLLDRYFSK